MLCLFICKSLRLFFVWHSGSSLLGLKVVYQFRFDVTLVISEVYCSEVQQPVFNPSKAPDVMRIFGIKGEASGNPYFMESSFMKHFSHYVTKRSIQGMRLGWATPLNNDGEPPRIFEGNPSILNGCLVQMTRLAHQPADLFHPCSSLFSKTYLTNAYLRTSEDKESNLLAASNPSFGL